VTHAVRRLLRLDAAICRVNAWSAKNVRFSFARGTAPCFIRDNKTPASVDSTTERFRALSDLVGKSIERGTAIRARPTTMRERAFRRNDGGVDVFRSALGDVPHDVHRSARTARRRDRRTPTLV
jgi:hypothetical protein